jgi:hypothetical protein
MATSIYPVQVRGPALVGPHLQIREPVVAGPDGAPIVLAAVAGTTDLTAIFTTEAQTGPVSILMADDDLQIQGLSARWPTLSDPGWLVGTQTNLPHLQEAYHGAGVGNELRILIARTFADAIALSREWHQSR